VQLLLGAVSGESWRSFWCRSGAFSAAVEVRFLLLSGSGLGGIWRNSATPRTHGPVARGFVISCVLSLVFVTVAVGVHIRPM